MCFMKLDGKWAADPLIPAEQMGVGGHATVRGYEEREFLGDNAITGTLEFRTPIYLGILDRKSADAKGKPARFRNARLTLRGQRGLLRGFEDRGSK